MDDSPGGDWEQMLPPLPAIGILAGLSEQSLATLAAYGEYKHHKEGEEIITDGNEQRRFYIVVDGRLEIFGVVSGQEMSLAQIEKGECLGEVSLLQPGPASSTVRVIEPAILWSMDALALNKYLSEHTGGGGALLMGMAQCLSRRLRNANQLIAKHHLAIPAFQRSSQVITAQTVSPERTGLFGLFRRSGGEKKIKISTEIKL